MFGFELAQIYGYETRIFNQQVNRNIEKFPSDFMFKLTRLEMDSILMSQNVISSWGRSICSHLARHLCVYDHSKRLASVEEN